MSIKKVIVQRTLDSFFKKTDANKKREYSVSSEDDANKNVKKTKNNEIKEVTIKTPPSTPQVKHKPAATASATPSTPSSNKPPSFLSLESVINDPKCQIFKDNSCVCIKDKFAKSKQHYLLIPMDETENQKRFSQLLDLKKVHLKLLEHMNSVARDLIKNKFEINTIESYMIGFHSIQSMYPLHMHIITNDFVSECLKTKKHWNSFNSKYFINLDEIIEHLKENETLDDLLMSKELIEKALKSDLKCNQCTKVLSNMPKLKEHLEWHYKQQHKK